MPNATSRIRTVRLIALAWALLASAGAKAVNLTDLWWDPAESGWGANIVQQDDTAVVTLYVHGADGEPTWLIGVASSYAIGPGGLEFFSGPLYRAKGSWYGAPHDPGASQETPVGTVWLTPSSADELALDYVVNGVTVAKRVVRMTWRPTQAATWYLGSFTLRQVAPGGPVYGTLQYQAEVMFHIEGTAAAIKVDQPGSSCLHRGELRQSGRYSAVSGTFDCGGNDTGTFEVTGLEFTDHGVSGYLRTTRADRIEYGRFAGARY